MKEVLQVDAGTDEKTCRDRAVQCEQRIRDRAVQWEQRIRDRAAEWEQRIRDSAVQREQRTREHNAISRGILPDVVKGVIITERSPPAIRTRCCIMHAASVELLAVGWKLGPEQIGPEPVAIEVMTRKGGKDRRKETARARTPRWRKVCDSKVTADTVMNESIDTRIVGQDQCAECKLTLECNRTWILCASRHRCQ